MESQQEPQSQIQSYPIPNEADKAMASIATLLRESTNTLPILRREFRGESLYQYPDGMQSYIQTVKPMFVRTDPLTEKPLMKEIQMRDFNGDLIMKKVYIPNDEAIEEVLSMLKFMGLNQITLLSNIDEGTVLDDLKEFEMKLAGVLMLKQKAWGMDKEMLPMIQSKIKTIVQDARYQAVNGSTLKAIQKTVQRVEQAIDKTGDKRNPFN
jgi:hypothetical protein|tara:strand:- start:8784 stop:9413 length:630 start_codon:yes stop_codon:yes gene_type:complete